MLRTVLLVVALVGLLAGATRAGAADPAERAMERVAITPAEMAVIRAWLATHPRPIVVPVRAEPAALDFDAPVPLPHGWQGMLQRGNRLPPNVYQAGRPLAPELVAQLPAGPRATMLIELDGKILRMFRPTRTILDLAPL
jgi:hypothetical protein